MTRRGTFRNPLEPVSFFIICSLSAFVRGFGDVPATPKIRSVFALEGDQKWTVPENTPVGTTIAQITVANPKKEITYILESESEMREYFGLNKSTGVITLLKPLNAQTHPFFMLKPGVFNGVFPSYIEIHVYVQNASDNTASPLAIQPSVRIFSPFSPPDPPSIDGLFRFPSATKKSQSTWQWATTPASSSSSVLTLHNYTKEELDIWRFFSTKRRKDQDFDDDNNHDFDSPSNGGKWSKKGERKLDEDSNNRNYWWIVLGIAGVIVAALTIWLLVRRRKKMRSASEKIHINKTSSGASVSTNGTVTAEFSSNDLAKKGLQPQFSSNRYLYRRKSNNSPVINNTITSGSDGYLSATIPEERWEFPRKNITVLELLGEGCFGQVFKAQAFEPGGLISTVAVKTLKHNAGEKERRDLVNELHVMKCLEPHPNVVELLGCCTDQDPIYLIMEYAALGKLQSFLRRSRNSHYYGNHQNDLLLTSHDLTSFAYQVARGMQYLSSKGILHRDLAARNILIAHDRICKVSDFGLARDVIDEHIYERKSEGRLPIRWMAPESLFDNIFTTKTDVWSFGILFWEIVTLGSTPYPGMPAAEVMRKIKEGYRPERPEYCKRELYNIMYYCWHDNANERPSFEELVERLSELLAADQDYLDLNHFPENSYYNTIMTNVSGEKV